MSRTKSRWVVAASLALAAFAGVVVGRSVAMRSEAAAVAQEPANIAAQLASVRDELARLRFDVEALSTAFSKGVPDALDAFAENADRQEERVLARIDAAEHRITREFAAAIAPRTDSASTPVVIAGARGAPDEAALHADDTVSSPSDASTATSIPLPPLAPADSAAPADGASSESTRASRSKSFLSFRLPSSRDDFGARRRFVVVSDLSRVGFDAKSTLHDFSGATNRVRGELIACLAHAGDGCRGSITVDAAALSTGLDDRDENMQSDLDVKAHPDLAFVIDKFDTARADAESHELEGRVSGKMTIRGVTRELSMPVRAVFDASKRLVVEGEASLHLPDYGVPVPNKLGLIRMEPDVRVWISLRLRSTGDEGDRGDAN